MERSKLNIKPTILCYASEKAVDYQAAGRMNSPVKLSNIKFTPSIIDKETLDI
jgi:hypothetical protein